MYYVRASILLGSEKRKDGVEVAPTLLPSVHKLQFTVCVREVKDGNDEDCVSLGLEYFASLQDVRVTIDCRGASVAEVEEREAALRRVVDVHPNHPTLEVTRYEEEEMISDAQNQEVR